MNGYRVRVRLPGENQLVSLSACQLVMKMSRINRLSENAITILNVYYILSKLQYLNNIKYGFGCSMQFSDSLSRLDPEEHSSYAGGTDSYIPRPPKMRKYKLEKSSVPLTADTLKKYDCVVIATDQADYVPEFILENAQICDYLIEKGHEVVCVDNLLTGKPENIVHFMGNLNTLRPYDNS